MKKLVILFSLLLLVPPAFAQSSVVVPLFFRNGVHIVPCTLNGIPLEFILDTGASSICISDELANDMLEEGYLSKDDILGWSRAQVADGRYVDCRVVIFRNVEIGGLHLYNVEGVAIKGQDSGLLLGQTVLRRLGPYSIVGNQLIIQRSADPESDGTASYLLERAESCLAAGNYLGMISPLEEMLMLSIISPYGMSKLVQAYSMTQQYDKCISSFRVWEREYSSETEPIDMCDTYIAVANSFISGSGRYEDAIGCLVNAVDCLHDSSNFYEEADERYAEVFSTLGICYEKEGKREDAISAYESASAHRMRYLELNPIDIYKGKSRDGFLADLFYRAAALCPENSQEFAIFICSANKLGNSAAKSYLETYDRTDRCKNRYRDWVEKIYSQDYSGFSIF